MTISKTSLNFINHFFSLVTDNMDILTKNTINEILKKMHIKLSLSDKFYNLYQKQIKKESVVVNEKTYLSKQFKLIKNGNFIPSIIHKKIKKINFNEIYYFKIKNVEFQVHFVSIKKKSRNDLDKKIKKIIKMIHFLLSFHVDLNVESINILLFLTNEKKELPVNSSVVLNEMNVNTAVTYSCSKNGEVFLYREEEYFKVLIHELLHSLCFDFSKLSISFDIKSIILKMFNVNSKFYIAEAYAEFWANIINTSFVSYEYLKDKQDVDDFIYNFKILNLFEKFFSIFQCIKMLDFMGLTYLDVISKDKKTINFSLSKYKENTNVFAYHILKMVWLFNTESFINWFNKNNIHLIYSQKTTEYTKNILKKTKTHYNDEKLLELIKYIEIFYKNIKNINNINNNSEYESTKDLLKNARMCLLDI